MSLKKGEIKFMALSPACKLLGDQRRPTIYDDYSMFGDKPFKTGDGDYSSGNGRGGGGGDKGDNEDSEEDWDDEEDFYFTPCEKVLLALCCLPTGCYCCCCCCSGCSCCSHYDKDEDEVKPIINRVFYDNDVSQPTTSEPLPPVVTNQP